MILVSVGLVNGETGVIQDLESIVEIVRQKAPEALIHTDAVQAFPWLDVASLAQSADLISIAGHKFGAPKGLGRLLFVTEFKFPQCSSEVAVS